MRRALLTLAFSCTFSPVAWSQDQDRAPMLNAVGRFFGVGYSAGYHARTESRFGVHRYVPDHNVVPEPARGMFANPNVRSTPTLYPYMPANAGAMSYAPVMNAPTSAPVMMGSQSPAHVPGRVPVKPIDPPPSWLKQYIRPGADGSSPSDDELLNENSPSDRKGELMVPPPTDSTTSISITPSQPPLQIGGRPVISILQQ